MSPRAPAFLGEPLDRAAERRGDEAWLARALAASEARAVLVGEAGPLMRGGEAVLLAPGPARERGAAGDPLFLGVRAGAPLFALEVPGALDGRPAGAEFADLHQLAAELPAADSAILAHATSLVAWHRAHRFCARCGSPTVSADGGYQRRCLAHEHVHHPRTDPVMIVLVTDGTRALLGRQARWPAGRYSALAGFVEPGESAEAAVAREVREEAGVEIERVRYLSSQPWPFPGSLMLGFSARWAGGEPRARDGELEDVRFFEREAVAAAARAGGEPGGLHLPGPYAIARMMIERWLARPRRSAT